MSADEAERAALRARRRADAACTDAGVRHYFASWSFSTITYKALVISDRLTAFFPDLAAADFEAPFTIFHSRFSTNTAPAWERAQPFRYLCHNGEINTIQGNERRMDARGVLGTEAAGLGPEELFRPLLDPDDSDSGKLDAAVELLLRGGRDVRHVVAMLVPEAWEGAPRPRPGRARLLPVPRVDLGAVGRPGRRRSSPTAVASARRSTATVSGPCAGSAPPTASSCARRRRASCRCATAAA